MVTGFVTFARFLLLLAFGLCRLADADDYPLDFDGSCKHYGADARDVRPILQNAFDTAKTVAASAGTRLAWAYNNGNSNADRQSQLSDEEIWELVRIERLEVTFSISPYAANGQYTGSATGIIFHEPNNNGYDETMVGFLSVLNTLAKMDPERVPIIYCGVPTSPVGTAKRGTVEKYTEWNGKPILDADGDESFAYMSFLDITTPQASWMPVGEEICYDEGGHQATIDFLQPDGENAKWIIFCDPFFTEIDGVRPSSAIDLPIGDDRGSDFESEGRPFNYLSFWHLSAVGVMLHEMHHIFIPGSEDVKIPKNFNMPGTGRTIPANTEVAYGYVFTTILAGQISASQGPYETLWLNPDTVAMKAIGIYLFGCDWAMDTALRLVDVAFAVPGDILSERRI